MAITIHLYYTGQGEAAQNFAKEMISSGVVAKIRAEEGNLGYNYYVSLEHPETVLLVDQWENQEAIDRHHASEMMSELAALRDKYDLKMQVKRYIEDEEGTPAKDQQFIRQ